MRRSLMLRRLGTSLMHRRVAVIVAVGVSLVAATAAAVGWWPVAVGVIAFVQVCVVLLVVDTRKRMARSSQVQGMFNAALNMERSLANAERTFDSAARRLDNIGSRLLAVVEDGRVETNDGLAELRGVVGRVLKQTTRLQTSVGDYRARQIEAMIQLYRRVKPRAAMPPSGGWAMDAANILMLLNAIEHSRPNLVLELGGGTSSLWLGYTLERLGSGRLVSIDQDPEYADVTRALVRSHRLEHTVEVRVAPLIDDVVPDHDTPWYDPVVFKDLSDIDVLIVDGPTKATGAHARYPALPVLAGQLSDQALVVLDDADRTDEAEALRRWIEETPGLKKMNVYSSEKLACLMKNLSDEEAPSYDQ